MSGEYHDIHNPSDPYYVPDIPEDQVGGPGVPGIGPNSPAPGSTPSAPPEESVSTGDISEDMT
jgi:hypothetical protein